MPSPVTGFLRAVSITALALSAVVTQAQSVAGLHPGSASVRIGPEGGYLKDRGSSRVLVFVPGFSAAPDSDFRCDDAYNWPEMIAADSDPTLASADIYVLGYPPPSHRGKSGVADLETSIVDRLTAAGVLTRHQDIVFIGHAMGGLLVQQIIAVNSQKDWVHQVRAVFLYGTPQGTAKLAGLGRYLDADPRLKEMEGNGNNFLLRTDDPIWTGIPHFCGYETLSDDGFSTVEYGRNTRGCTDMLAIHANHANIAQPCRTDDAAYIFLEDKLRALFPPA